MRQVKIYIILVLVFVVGYIAVSRVFAQSASPSPTPSPTSSSDSGSSNSDQVKQLQEQIADYQKKISDLQGQEHTLSSAIQVIDNQIKVNELRIDSTKQQIDALDKDIDITKKRISNLENDITVSTKAMLGRIAATYKVGQQQPWEVLLSSSDVTNFFSRLKYLRIMQEYDKKVVYAAEQSKVNYAAEKNILETKQDEEKALQDKLQGYNDEIGKEKDTKQKLLSDTQGNEANYQKQLAQAQAQLASLARFATTRAGSGGSIIGHIEQSDGWGKYYNQRDANWGNHLIGTSSEQIWEVGCLLTSYTMVATHFGGSLTPADVASNTDNFAFGTAWFRIPGPSANGHSASYVSNPSIDSLKSEVQAGNPVVAGLSANGGPYPQHYSDHWVVLRGIAPDGSFLINDPWYADGMNVSLNNHYSGWAIIEARIYR
jgi:peptidoglycan hydrolase CwlO-like protein